jgi:hypothetical protein
MTSPSKPGPRSSARCSAAASAVRSAIARRPSTSPCCAAGDRRRQQLIPERSGAGGSVGRQRAIDAARELGGGRRGLEPRHHQACMLAGDPATVGVAQPVVEGRRVGDGAAQRAEPRIVVDADHHAEIDLARSVLAGGDRHHIARGPHGRERLGAGHHAHHGSQGVLGSWKTMRDRRRVRAFPDGAHAEMRVTAAAASIGDVAAHIPFMRQRRKQPAASACERTGWERTAWERTGAASGRAGSGRAGSGRALRADPAVLGFELLADLAQVGPATSW